MAIYKPSNCVPFSTAVDLTQDMKVSFDIHTSNQQVKSYKLRILDSANNEIFMGSDWTDVSSKNWLNGTRQTITVVSTKSGTDRNVIYYDGASYYSYASDGKTKVEIANFKNGYVNQPYKWQVILKQADGLDDMTIAIGTVIGSTPQRIQPDFSEEIYKDYFVQIGTKTTEGGVTSFEPIGNRALISAYDRSFGYIYPKEGVITEENFENSNSFQVYKNSNDPSTKNIEQLVNYITTEGALKTVTYGGSSYTNSKRWEPGDGGYFTQEFEDLYIGSSNSVPASFYDHGISETSSAMLFAGNTILVNEQGDGAIYNGIFTLQSVNSTRGSFPQSYQVGNNVFTIEQTTWAWASSAVIKNVGKPITVEFTQQNPEPSQTISYSWSYNEVNQQLRLSIYGEGEDTLPSVWSATVWVTFSDDRVLTTVTFLRSASADTWGEFLDRVFLITDGTYKLHNFENDANQNIGGVINKSSINFFEEKPIDIYPSKTTDLDRTTGTIYKNEAGRTYIRPNTAVQKDMEFVCTTKNNASVNIDDINKTNWYIDHATVSPFNSALTADEDKYKIITNFKYGDEIPFYAYAAPKLEIVDKATGRIPGDTVQVRNITLKGTFSQDNNKSWVSNQWIISNDKGFVKQSAVYYGGSPEYTINWLMNGAVYTVTWLVEDEFGNNLAETISFKVDIQNEQKIEPAIFRGEYDCLTQSFLVNVLSFKFFKVKEKISDAEASLIFQTKEPSSETGSVPFKVVYTSSPDATKVTMAVYRQEISNDAEPIELTPAQFVSNKYKFQDYGIANNHRYRYIAYKTETINGKTTYYKGTLDTGLIRWDAWSITELHPVTGGNSQFTASKEDVWLFNLNLSTGAQTQNIIRESRQTLGQFNQYSQGELNYISGDVNCLLGSQVVPASYVVENGVQKFVGGYQEKLLFNSSPTSNERVDMLNAWRKVVKSPNPKLLKDRLGQIFLITIDSSSNTPQDNVGIQPNTLNFSWSEIGSMEDISVVDESTDLKIINQES